MKNAGHTRHPALPPKLIEKEATISSIVTVTGSSCYVCLIRLWKLHSVCILSSFLPFSLITNEH